MLSEERPLIVLHIHVLNDQACIRNAVGLKVEGSDHSSLIIYHSSPNTHHQDAPYFSNRSLPNREGTWKAGGCLSVGDQQLCSGSGVRSMR